MEWQPIETAPSYMALGTPILLCIYPVYRCFVGIRNINGDFAILGQKDSDGYPTICKPTHWMPLPAPPTNTQEGEI